MQHMLSDSKVRVTASIMFCRVLRIDQDPLDIEGFRKRLPTGRNFQNRGSASFRRPPIRRFQAPPLTVRV